MSLVSFPSWGLTMDDLVERDGLYYQKFTDVPFTGEIDEGLKRGNFKNGKFEGIWIKYWDNGQLEYKSEYKNGEPEGWRIGYHKNGQLKTKGYFKDGNPYGLWVDYYKNGQFEKTYRFKNGKPDGLWQEFYENGEMKSKEHYENGRLINRKHWILSETGKSYPVN